MNMLSRNTFFNGKNFKAFPQVDWKAATVRKKADPYLKVSAKCLEGIHWGHNSPPDLVKRMELVRDSGNRSRNNRHVQRHKENCQAQGDHNHRQRQLGGII